MHLRLNWISFILLLLHSGRSYKTRMSANMSESILDMKASGVRIGTITRSGPDNQKDAAANKAHVDRSLFLRTRPSHARGRSFGALDSKLSRGPSKDSKDSKESNNGSGLANYAGGYAWTMAFLVLMVGLCAVTLFTLANV
eukprot:TRINITY_DN67379_c0_g1_i1.p1 TRINITY_DN67379_c0_g1~~TRINITY_DN67379_c0_g1_i1.p1  ORF type:complete len:152 (+),score=13.38 TRINITY_DN67379_c0_g1_i1:36-458(+)